MKKFFIAAVAVIGSIAVANAQADKKAPDNCTGCTANTYDNCTTPVTVSLANVLKMTCDNCESLSSCANTIDEWKNGLNLGNATFSIASTKSFSVFAGVDQAYLQSGSNKINIGSGSSNVQLYAKVTNNGVGGSAVTSPTALTKSTSSTSQSNAGSKLISAAPASLTAKSATLNFTTGTLPLNTPNGDYSVNVIVSAIQD
ncbi:MAG: hypothetical protein DI598_09250 [Pseudopedobacter saltans]|uniref:Uncharacterized protein n=1 Tax=Pseudopedobacter saltans TaxID=151895 RepID=A0A2W5EXY7_9SPHI|nr:MAG: hypothetical protein DI598_09250 [Pseudopedobacter saltans]